MKQGISLAACEAYLAKQDPNQAECQDLLEALFAYTQKLERQQNRLVKLSDASEAKLTSTNETLGKLTANLSRFVPDTVVKALLADNQDAVTHTSKNYRLLLGYCGVHGPHGAIRARKISTDHG